MEFYVKKNSSYEIVIPKGYKGFNISYFQKGNRYNKRIAFVRGLNIFYRFKKRLFRKPVRTSLVIENLTKDKIYAVGHLYK